MRTLLSHFCDQFEAISRPLLDPLGRAVEALASAPFDLPARRILPGLRDVRQQFEQLVEKVAGQQSYVLIFGPLKSGKSTLMNAVAASYVSEVTCLPAYPCMVYVSHREERELEVTRYDGTSTTYGDPNALRKALTRAHADLAEKIRARGEGEETFDPGIHFPEAIRRVDVGLPAGQLARSGAVLVDTPGLYARMRFGYDRMTREFRNSAACAVFVVKTDNLFLEQVFEEFGRLLDLFSRIFLVVNLDSTKQDLRPDGSLVPSLESEDPSRVVETFEKLSMDGALRNAVLEGKLRIYPVDLLRAASVRLRGQAADADPALAPTEAETAAASDFDRFQGDLTAYLNSNDYLRAFLADSLRQADALIRESGLLCDMGPVRELAESVSTLRSERDVAHRRVERLQEADGIDWRAAFAGLRPRLQDATKDRAREIHEKTADAIRGLVDRWFEGDGSLRALLDEEAAALFASSLREAAPMIHGALRECAAAGAAGARLPFEVRETLADMGIHLDDVARQALEGVDPLAGAVAGRPVLEAGEIPVRRGLLDWVLFRGRTAIRRRVFGTPQAPTATIPAAVKAKRLGPAARDALRRALQARLDAFYPRAVLAMIDRVFDGYAPAVVERVRPAIRARQAESEATLASIDGRLTDAGRVVDELTALGYAMSRGVEEVAALTRRHAETDPALLDRPMATATPEGGEPEAGKDTAAA